MIKILQNNHSGKDYAVALSQKTASWALSECEPRWSILFIKDKYLCGVVQVFPYLVHFNIKSKLHSVFSKIQCPRPMTSLSALPQNVYRKQSAATHFNNKRHTCSPFSTMLEHPSILQISLFWHNWFLFFCNS
jgi:hypothetical protein